MGERRRQSGVNQVTEKREKSVIVSTYVPPYQREQWVTDAEEMNMNLSEFVRCMVQAGRRSFDLSAPYVLKYELRDDVVAGLRTVSGLTWDEMTDALPSGASESDLESILEELQKAGDLVVRRGGEYVLVDR